MMYSTIPAPRVSRASLLNLVYFTSFILLVSPIEVDSRSFVQGKAQTSMALTRSKLLTNATPTEMNATAEPSATVPMRIEYSTIAAPLVSLQSARHFVIKRASFIGREHT